MSPAPKQGERYELSQEKCADGAARADARNARDPPSRTLQKFLEERTAKLKVHAISTMTFTRLGLLNLQCLLVCLRGLGGFTDHSSSLFSFLLLSNSQSFNRRLEALLGLYLGLPL